MRVWPMGRNPHWLCWHVCRPGLKDRGSTRVYLRVSLESSVRLAGVTGTQRYFCSTISEDSYAYSAASSGTVLLGHEQV